MQFRHLEAPSSSSSDNNSGDGLIPDCGIVGTISEKNALIRSSYVLARNEIIQKSIEQLSLYAPQTWICSKYLFNSQTLPPSISVSQFGMEMWNSNEDILLLSNETEVYSGSNGTVLLRHKFEDGYYYYRACRLSNQRYQQDKLELQELVDRALQERNNSTCDSESLGVLTDAMAALLPQALGNVMVAKELRVDSVPRTYTATWREEQVTSSPGDFTLTKPGGLPHRRIETKLSRKCPNRDTSAWIPIFSSWTPDTMDTSICDSSPTIDTSI